MSIDSFGERFGFWLLLALAIAMAPVLLGAEVVSWFERRR